MDAIFNDIMKANPLRIFLLACVAGMFSISIVAAQQGVTLDYNTALEGEVTDNSGVTFTFNARDGAMLSFIVRALDDDLDPVLHIHSSSGELLLHNDDYDYPNSRDSLIEGFSVPRNGTYTATITGFGETQGAFEILMLPGYSQVIVDDAFDGSRWQAVSLNPSGRAATITTGGSLELDAEGVRQTRIATTPATMIDSADLYALADIRSVSGRNGWRAGITFRHRDANNHYEVLIDNRGLWRFAVVSNGEQRLVRDWSSHPAIIPDNPSFSLGVLANGSSFEVFYDGQLIGSITDDTLTDAGSVGLAIGTTNALGSSTTAEFGRVIITVPTQLNEGAVFTEQILMGSANATMRELQRRRVVPASGEMAFTLSESIIQLISPGVSRFPLARGITYHNFVMGATISWETLGNGISGCGLIFRDQGGDSNEYVLAYIESTGGYGLTERRGESFINNAYTDAGTPGSGPVTMIVVADGDTVSLYVQGRYVGSIDTELGQGGIGEAVVNFDSVDTSCRFTDLWLWRFD